MKRITNSDAELVGPFDQDIRLIQVLMESSPTPTDELITPVNWTLPTEEYLEDFSSICWMTARYMKEESNSDVPLGMIHSSWGGSRIEAWMSTDLMESTGLDQTNVEALKLYQQDPSLAVEYMGQLINSWWREIAADETPIWKDNGPASEWMDVPAGIEDWQQWGEKDLDNYVGLLWYRAEITLPDDYEATDAVIEIGMSDDRDAVWVNGDFVGTGLGWGYQSRYPVSAATLKPGKNTVIMGIVNDWGPGGLSRLETAGLEINGKTLPFEKLEWTRQFMLPAYPRIPWQGNHGLSTLHNSMINPFKGFSLTGALWYQGENNVDNPDAYTTFLPSLIQDWRDSFNSELKFIIMQISAYGALAFEPKENGWPEVRDVQRRVAQKDDLTGLVVTSDIGNIYDIHPGNKRSVAFRTVQAINALNAGKFGLADGAQPVRATRTRKGIEITFENVTESLKIYGGDMLTGLEACTSTNNCTYVNASLKDDHTLFIPMKKHMPADKIRYAWGEAPILTLFESNEAPVSKFQGQHRPVSPFEIEVSKN